MDAAQGDSQGAQSRNYHVERQCSRAETVERIHLAVLNGSVVGRLGQGACVGLKEQVQNLEPRLQARLDIEPEELSGAGDGTVGVVASGYKTKDQRIDVLI